MKIPAGKIIVSLVFIFAAALTIRSVSALSLNPELLKDKIPLLKVDPWVVRCSAVQSLAEKKLNKFDDNKNKHFKIYIQLTTLLSDKIDKWDEEGLDTEQVKKDLAVIEEKMDKFNEDYASYKSKLKAITEINCDDTETDYKNAIKDAKDTLKLVRKDVVDIKTYYWTQMRADIVDLKKQIISNSGE